MLLIRLFDACAPFLHKGDVFLLEQILPELMLSPRSPGYVNAHSKSRFNSESFTIRPDSEVILLQCSVWCVCYLIFI